MHLTVVLISVTIILAFDLRAYVTNITWCQKCLFTMEQLKTPCEMDFTITDSVTLAEKWRCWRQTMGAYLNLRIPNKLERKNAVYSYISLDRLEEIFIVR